MMSDTSDKSDAGEMRNDSTTARPGRTPIEPSRRDAVEDWLALFVRMLGLPASETEAVRDELEDHLRSRVDDLLITGVSEPEAVRRAVSELGETATLAQGFRNARRRPPRRTAMYALFAIAGSALVLSSTALYNGGGTSNGLPATQPEVVAIEGEAAGTAQFDEHLSLYEVEDLVHAPGPLEVTTAGEQLLVTIIGLVEHPVGWVRFGDIAANSGTVPTVRTNGEEVSMGRIGLVGNTLFVGADPAQQKGVAWVLASLRDTAARMRAKQQAEIDLRNVRAVEQNAQQEAAQQEMRNRLAQESSERQKAAVDNERQRREMNERARADRIAELQNQYVQLKARLIELRQRQYDSEVMVSNKMRDLSRGKDVPDIERQAKQDEANHARIAERTMIELETVEVTERLVRVRGLLLDMELGIPSAVSWDAARRELEPVTSPAESQGPGDGQAPRGATPGRSGR